MDAYAPNDYDGVSSYLVIEARIINHESNELAQHCVALAELELALRTLLSGGAQVVAPPVPVSLLLFLQMRLTHAERDGVWRALRSVRRFERGEPPFDAAYNTHCLDHGCFDDEEPRLQIGGEFYDSQLVFFWLCFARHTTLEKLAPNPLEGAVAPPGTITLCSAPLQCINPAHIGTSTPARAALIAAREAARAEKLRVAEESKKRAPVKRKKKRVWRC